MSSPPANPGTRFDGKVAFITGSSRGMGWQNAIELPSRRASIVINYANSAFAADNVVKESKAAEIVHDQYQKLILCNPVLTSSPNFGPKKITVNAIAPGGLKTDMYTEVVKKYIPGSENWSEEQLDKAASSWSPLSRPGFPSDVSRVVAFLASEDGGWINGQVLTIGGGAAM